MATEYTRGPWEVHALDGKELCVVPDPDSRHPDTYLGVCTINTWEGERSTRTNEANACLIAAAPELLRALAQLELAVTDIRGIDMESYCGSELDQARAAIAKATRP